MSGERPVSGAGVFFGDVGAVLLVLNEEWRRVLGRLFGISRDDSMLVTLILIGVVAEALQRKTSWLRKRPSAADAVLGAGALSNAAQRLAGDWSQDTPFLLALVALAVVWKNHPLARISIRGARGSIHGAITGWRKARTYGAGPAPSRAVFDRR